MAVNAETFSPQPAVPRKGGLTRLKLPGRDVIAQAAQGDRSYTGNNFYKKRLGSMLRTGRLRHVLKLAARFPARRVIDMGCADGLLLPTLSANYEQVTGIDAERRHATHAQRLAKILKLKNVSVLCNQALTFEQVRRQVGSQWDLMFLLEIIEHVGKQPNMWDDKISFINGCFSLLKPDAKIIVSVPNMVGMSLLIKQVGKRCIGVRYDRMTLGQLMRSAFLKDTDQLEAQWDGHHLGFNHLKLEAICRRHFDVLHREQSLSNAFFFFVLGRRAADAIANKPRP